MPKLPRLTESRGREGESMARFVFARSPELERSWPFVHQRLVERLSAQGDVVVAQVGEGSALGEHADLSAVDAVAHLRR
ncbi:MAG: hypothetical protein WKG07_35775 [Hymenobacter sp.]